MKKAIILLLMILVVFCGTEPEKNHTPEISYIMVNPVNVRAGETCILTAVANDVDGDVMSFSWSSAHGTFSSPTANPVEWTAPSVPGIYSVTCTVSDDKASSDKSIDITVLQ